MSTYVPTHFPPALIKDIRESSRSPLSFPDLSQELGILFPRLDLFLSMKSLILGASIRELLPEHFRLGLLKYMQFMEELGYLGNFGQTVDPIKYLMRFPSSGVTLLWIPKNANTAVKKMLLNMEPQDSRERIRPNRFHETCQREFGLSRECLPKLDVSETVAVIRDPYERLVSCYLDKFATPAMRQRRFEPFVLGHIKAAHAVLGLDRRPADRSISFCEFVNYISASAPYSWDSHWRPQYCFLHHLERRAQMIPVERLDVISSKFGSVPVKKVNPSAGLKRVRDEDASGEFAHILPEDLQSDMFRSYNQFLTPEIMQRLRLIYERDEYIYDAASKGVESGEWPQIRSVTNEVIE